MVTFRNLLASKIFNSLEIS